MTALTDAIDNLSPTHYWKLDETTGATAFDTGSGTTRNMTHVNSPFLAVNGPTDEDVGVAYNGVDQLTHLILSGAGAGDIGTSNTGTFILFMRADTFAERPVTFATTASNGFTWEFRTDGSNFGASFAVLDVGGSTQSFEISDIEAMPGGEWYMMAFVHSGTTMTGWLGDSFIPSGNFILSGAGAPDGSAWIDFSPWNTTVNRFAFGGLDRLATIYSDIRVSNVAYFDGTALSESQLEGVYDVFAAGSAPIDPPDVPVVKNAWASTLLSLNPEHWWKLDETTGDALDTGSVGGFDMVETDGSGNRWRLAPGPIRGQPREYALWGSQSLGGGLVRLGTGLPATGFTTGVLGGVIYVYSTNNKISYLIQQIYNSNFGHLLELTVQIDGSFGMRVGISGAAILTAVTATGLAIDGNSYVVIGVQRADTTGLHIYVDGVDVTATSTPTGGADQDSFPDDVLTGEVASNLTISALGSLASSGGSQSGGILISNPFVFVNSVLSDAEIANLSDAALVNDDRLTDYFETVFFLGGENIQVWVPGWSMNANEDVMEVGNNIIENDIFATGITFNSPNPSTKNNAESGGVGKQIISEFNNYYYKFAAQASDANAQSALVNTSDVGTFNFIGRIGGVEIGGFNTIYRYGNAGQPNSNVTAAFFYLAGSSFGYKWGMRFTQAGGAFIQVLAGSFTIPEPDEIKMFTVTQDGTGILFYVDGELINTDDTSSGVTYDFEDWIGRVDDATGTTIGNIGGSNSTAEFEPNELHDIFMLDRALTSVEVATLWDAVNGIFPPQDTDLGAWADELQNTGNGDLDEGPGPDWWWRMNAEAAPIFDVGIAQNRAVSPINADSITEGGDPLYEVSGPLPEDGGNRAIYFDGLGDYFEIGVNSVAGELADTSTGTIGCFFSPNALEDENIIYSQANDLYTAYWTWGLNENLVELIVQTSAGNLVTFTSSIEINDNFFHFLVLTCDGLMYRLYIDGVEDIGAIVIEDGGQDGDWFDAFAADNSAVGARADSGFTTETTGRISELFLYDGEVLTSTEIATLYEAAIEDGTLGSAAISGVVVFENVTFLHGALGDIHVSNSGVDFLQVLQVNRGRFLGGAQGSDIYRPQSVLLKGQVQAQFRGCVADLQDTPAYGRAGIVGTQIDPTAVSAAYGSILVTDCDFESMGYLPPDSTDGEDLLGPVMCEAGFGMSVIDSRFYNSNGSAIMWLADSQRVSVINNQVDGTTESFGAITARKGLNTRIGSGWIIRGNQVSDTDGNAYVIGGNNVDNTGKARNIMIDGNQSVSSEIAYRLRNIGDVIVVDNMADDCTNGVRVEECESSVMVRRNRTVNHSGVAYIAAELEETTQLMDLVIDRNTADGGGITKGLTVAEVRNVSITNNKLLNMDFGIQLGNIVLAGVIGHNQVEATTPFFILALTTQNNLVIGRNQIQDLGNAALIDVSSTEISVLSHYHSIEAGSAQDLETILGPAYEGFTLILRLAAFSSDITVVDNSTSGENIFLNGNNDFIMDTDNDQLWLVGNGTNWYEVSRLEQ